MRYVLVSAALLLAACGSNDPVAEESETANALPAPETVNVSDPSGAPPPSNAMKGASASTTNLAAANSIPERFHGRWGMTPADCTSTRGDAKGLLAVSATGLRFYESRAVPQGNVGITEDSFSADFAFTGEGQNWSKFQTLQLKDGKLLRTESSPMASYTYVRCA